MTKYVSPVKYNRFKSLDSGTHFDLKRDRKFRVDRPKDVSELMRDGVNKL